MSAFVWTESAATRARAIGACAWLLAALALAVGPAVAQTTNSIDSLTVTKGASGRTFVRFTLKAPPATPPAGFAIANPARVALDFVDTGNGLGRATQEISDATLRSVNVVQAGNRTRVVLNLNKPQTFETQVEGNVVQVTLFDQSESLDARAQPVQRFAEARPGDVQHALRDVDFRRGTNGEGRIVVELSDNSTGIDIRQQGKLLIVDFIGTSVPRNLERRLDVAGLRDAGGLRRHPRAGRQRAHDRRAQGPVGALGLPGGQALHPRGQADPGGPEQADAGDAGRATRARSCRSTSRTSRCARCCR